MFRTKKDVEKHVSDVLSKINNENEKNLRGYTFARLFFQVKDYESARKYLSGFLSVRDHHAPAHKLMAQIYEATNSPENALQSFKRSLEIDSHQNDIVLKICELYCLLPVDHETAKYWADRAEQIYPHNEIVFKLRECLVSAEGDPDHQELENLIATELQAQPKNIDLRIKLLRLYLDTERVKEAYEHATLIESKMLFASSSDWYYMLSEIYEAYQEECKSDVDSQFFINYLTALDHLISLNLSEARSRENSRKCSLNDAVEFLFTFDNCLKKAVEQNINEGSWTYFIHHMKGQLFFNMITILLKKAKMDQGNRKEAVRFSAGLALLCYSIKSANPLEELWFSQLTESQKVFTNFFQQGSIRTSFIGHVIKSMCKEDKGKWLQKIKSEVCIFQVKERIYNRIFSSVKTMKNLSTSYFINNSTFENSSLEFPSDSTLLDLDKFAYKLCASSLHHLVWLQIQGGKLMQNCPLTEIFKGLQYSNKNLSKGSCESLCILDLEAYLYATVYQTKSRFERKKSTINNWNQDLSVFCPPDIADPMCTEQQGEWWRVAYGLHTCSITEKLGESRRLLQQGLEVIRGVGNHGMEAQLVVHLAQSFASRAEILVKDLENSNREKKMVPDNIAALQFRATHYWNVGIAMLEKLLSNGIIKPPKEPMFVGYYNVLTKPEMRNLLEDGKLYMAVQLMEADKLNEAADILSKLSSPYSSFYLALTLKKFASQEDKFSNSRKMFLTKAQNAVHDTMDRIKDDNSHPLNREIHIVLEEIENELNTGNSINNGTSDDPDEVDAYDACATSNSSIYTTPNNISLNLHSTPKPSSKFMPNKSKLSYTNSDNLKHCEPSPERLDAQIRALALNQDTVIKSIMEQNKSLLETNKSIQEILQKNYEVLTDLKKQLEDLKISDTRTHPKTLVKTPTYLKGQGDNEYENIDPNALLEYYEENNEEYRIPDYNYNPQHSRMVPEAATPINYVVPPTLPPGPPPSLAHYSYQYPHHAMLPPTAVPERPQYYAPPGQSLPFSEGQQLPQFHFHVSSAIGKSPAPILSSITNIPHPAMSLQQPSTSSSVIPPGPWAKPVGVPPHQFQIPLPPSVPFASASSPLAASTSGVTSQPSLRNLLSSTTTTTASSPLSNYILSSSSSATPTVTSNLFSNVAKTPEQVKADRSRCDSETAGSEVDGHDIEKEVMGDFKPLIPLPDEIVVETGEENEVVLFEDRAKLYRFVDQEWKERGIGIVKLLHHEESKRVRLLMRREQVLKVCANHYITPDMIIKPLKTSDRAWTWTAQDFADEELKPEHFCIRFKTSEVALAFKEAFEKAISLVKHSDAKNIASPNKLSTSSSPGPKPFSMKLLHKSGSWSCPTCYISNAADRQFCEACETKKPGYTNVTPLPSSAISSGISVASAKTSSSGTSQFTFGSSATISKTKETENNPKNVFGGFTFSSFPTIQEVHDPDTKEREILLVTTKSKDGPQVTKMSNDKPSPFSSFSFTSPAVTKSSTISQPPKGSVFSGPASLTTSTKESDTNQTSNFTFKMSDMNAIDLFLQSSPPKGHTESSTSNAPDFSLKLSYSNKTSEKPSESLSSLSKLQSMVQNVTPPTFVFNPSNTSVSKSDNTQSFSPITSNLNTSTKSNDGAPEEFVPTAEFKPVVPLPALVELKTGEEGEEIRFCERAKLFRYDSQSKQWKERGTGELKILYVKESQKYRILMRRDQVLKICANHYILPEMKLAPLPNSDRAWTWFAQDFSDEDLSEEKLAAKFKTVEIAKQFSEVFESCQNDLKQKEIKNVCKGNKDAFDKLFEPSSNSWKCSNCHKDNSNQSSCIYCKTPYKNASVIETKKVDNQTPLSELFKPTSGSWECSQCYVRNLSTDLVCKSCEFVKPGLSEVSNELNKPLSELFKPLPGSWVCDACMVRNSADKIHCQSCETAKPGFEGVSTDKKTDYQPSFLSNSKPTSNSSFSFGLKGDGFIFGSKPPAQPSNFTFGQSALTKTDQVIGFKPPLPNTTSSAVFGGVSPKQSAPEKQNVGIPPVTTAPTYVFGTSSTTDFSFSSLATQNSTSSTEFRFGSPQKYEFNFGGVRPRSPAKTPKSPRSPATPSDDEEDEVVASDDIYFTPVIPLPPKVEIKTGEESEKALFTQRAKLFRFCDGEWKERGLGDVKILFDDKTKKSRLVMRREQVLKVCLNHSLTKDIKFEWRNDKSLSWAATDFSENEATPELFAIRFKTAELAQEFKKSIDDTLSLVEAHVTPVSSSDALKNFSFKMETPKKSGSNFTPGSLSARFGVSAQEETSSNSSFTFKEKPASTSFFGQAAFGDSDSKPVFGTGFKFASSFNAQPAQTRDEEVEVVYEALPSPDKIALAEKLKLPKTFYLYENKEPCPGCVGCTDTILPSKGEVGVEEEKISITETKPQPEETMLFGSSSRSSISFNDLAAAKSSQPFFTSPSGGKQGFAGAGTPIFASLNTSGDTANDDTVSENPDIHFEPVIPLPDLVEVKTGEEDETPIFVHRAKLFRYDGTSKQWKERGIGDIKILKHNEKLRFRVILRRDQVHNIACNHCITPDMSLAPLATSENAVCWNAIDFSDGQGDASKFAVRFKAKDILEQFKKVFNECIEMMKKSPPASTNDTSGTRKTVIEKVEMSSAVKSQESPIKSQQEPTSESAENDDQNSDEISDEEELLYEKRVTYEIKENNNQSSVKSIGTLQMTYDDSVYGYRVTIVNDDDEAVCDHVIAIQNCLRVEGKRAFWSAIDMSVDPSRKRHFIATFSSLEAINEYQKYFEEGKEFAVKSGIVENDIFPANAKGQ